MVSTKIMATMALLSVATALPSLVSPRQAECPPWECTQDAEAVPACATKCINAAAPEFGCGQDDYNCACANFVTIRIEAAACVLTACKGIPLGSILDDLTALCGCVKTFPASDEPCTSEPAPSGASSVAPSASSIPLPSTSVSVSYVASVTGYPVKSVTKEVPTESTTTCTDKEDSYVPTTPAGPKSTGGYPGNPEKPTSDKPVGYKPTSDKPDAPYPTGDKPTGDKPYGTGVVVPVPVPSAGYPAVPVAPVCPGCAHPNTTVPAVPSAPVVPPTSNKPPKGDYPVTAGVAAKGVTVLGTLFAGLVAVVAAL